MDFSKRVVVNTLASEWISSTARGVKRIPLEREEMESGYTTSIVEYKKGTSFEKHTHSLGEEIFVLEGAFSDENGDYPVGTYIRNPPNSFHSPFSKEGCKILVKLNQFDQADKKEVLINTNDAEWSLGYGNLMVMPLHSFLGESIALVKWPKGEKFIPHTHFGGEEIFVLKGEFIDELGRYAKGTWIRSPHGSTHCPHVEEETIIYVKTGHLSK
jgi:anti-sigma factor ChrR (cupin superfamily)